jgi:hypothetical protein
MDIKNDTVKAVLRFIVAHHHEVPAAAELAAAALAMVDAPLGEVRLTVRRVIPLLSGWQHKDARFVRVVLAAFVGGATAVSIYDAGPRPTWVRPSAEVVTIARRMLRRRVRRVVI